MDFMGKLLLPLLRMMLNTETSMVSSGGKSLITVCAKLSRKIKWDYIITTDYDSIFNKGNRRSTD